MVRGLAKVGLVWAVAVLAVVFMAMSAQGQYGDAAPAAGADPAVTTAAPRPVAVANDQRPRAAGVALAVLFLAVGGSVLVVGAARDGREHRRGHPLT